MPRQITEIKIVNFATHRNTVIKPASAGKVTVITGQSSAGKSNVFRALRKLFYNIPSGTGFIRSGTNECLVSVKYDDGHIVSYRRTRGGISRYTVVYPDGRQPFEGDEGREGIVPLEVAEVTGIKPITIGGLDPLNINLAEQLDGPFLGTKVTTAPSRAKILGKLAGTEELDYAGKQLGTDIYRRKQTKADKEDDIKGFQAKLKQYEHLDDLKLSIDALTVIRDRVKQLTEKRNRLQELATQRQVLQIKIKAEDERFIATAFIEDAERGLGEIREMEHRLWLFRGFADTKYDSQVEITLADEIIDQTDCLEIAGNTVAQVVNLDSRKERLKGLSADLKNYQINIIQAADIIDQTVGMEWAAKGLDDCQDALIKNNRLKELTVGLNQANFGLYTAKNTLAALVNLDVMDSIFHRLINVSEKHRLLCVMRPDCKQATRMIQEKEAAIKMLDTIPEAEVILDKIQESLTKRNNLAHFNIVLDHYGKSGLEASRKILECDKQIELLQKQYLETLQEAGQCPTCGAEIKPEKLKEVV